jgi:hypothetical protein
MAKKRQEVKYACVALAKSVGGRCRHHEDGVGVPRYCSTHRNGDAEPVPLAKYFLWRFDLNMKWQGEIEASGIPFVEDFEGQTLRNLRHEKRADEVGRDFQAYCGSGEELQGGNGCLVFEPYLPSVDINDFIRDTSLWLDLVSVDYKHKKRYEKVVGYTVTFACVPPGIGERIPLTDARAALLGAFLGKTWDRVYVYDNPPNHQGDRKVSVNFTGPNDQKAKSKLYFADGFFDAEEVAAKKQDSVAA